MKKVNSNILAARQFRVGKRAVRGADGLYSDGETISQWAAKCAPASSPIFRLIHLHTSVLQGLRRSALLPIGDAHSAHLSVLPGCL